MYLRFVRLLLLIGTLSLGLFVLPALCSAQDGFAVQRLGFKGNKSFSGSILKLIMETKSVGGLSRLFGKHGPEYDDEVMSQDLEKLRVFYQREGFLYVKVGAVVKETDPESKTIKLTIPIDEGRPIAVRSVKYSLIPGSSLPDSILVRIVKRSKNDLLLKSPDRFRDSSVMLDQLLLTRALGNVGYPYADIKPGLAVSEKDFAVDVTWQIGPGPKCVFGDVRVVGVTKVPADVITRQIAFKKGELFRLRLAEQTQQQVYGLGMFQVATATPTFSEAKDSVVPVEVFVKDAKRFTTKLGVGYGTEDHVRVSSDTKLLGFLGGARRLQFFVKHSYLEPYHITATVVQPAFPTPHSTVTGSPFLWRQREPGFTVNRVGGSLGITHQFSPKLGGSITYSLEHVRVAQSVLAQSSDSSSVANLYNKSQIILGTTFDNSRPMFNPRQGFVNNNSFAISGLGFGSKTRYVKLQVDLRRYQPVVGCVFASRIKLGGIRTFGSESFVPVEERFYSGGSSSVRGWARSELGPHEEGIPIGGLSLIEGSAEFRYPIAGILSGVVFGDLGNVWSNSFSYKLSDLRYAAGVGIRITTPIGPLRVDVARPVADTDHGIQVHISVGQAF
jgi:outer membrane protein insertion porin family